MSWIPSLSSLAISTCFTLYLSSFPLLFFLCLSLWVFFSLNLSSSHLENSLLPYSHQPSTFIIFSSTIEETVSSVLSAPYPMENRERPKSLHIATREMGNSTSVSNSGKNIIFIRVCWDIFQWHPISSHLVSLHLRAYPLPIFSYLWWQTVEEGNIPS